METCARFELRSLDELEALAHSPLAPDVPASPPVRTRFRDCFLDTPSDALRALGVLCRIRTTPDGRALLSLRAHGENGAAERADERLRDGAPARALAASRRVVPMLRALVDPETLEVRLELEVERLTRTAAPDWLRRPRVELHYDRLLVRQQHETRSFHRVCVHGRRGGADVAERVSRALEREHGLRAVSGSARDRAELLLKWGRREEPRDRAWDSDALPGALRPLASTTAFAEFLNPELSLLAFQQRVLSLAEDPGTPLRERLRFLSIVTSNVDEFYMVRMAGLRRAAREQAEEQCEDGLTHQEQLALIGRAADAIATRQARCLRRCLDELAQLGVRLRRWGDLDPEAQTHLRAVFRREVQPELTPIALTLSPGHPLPHLPHRSLGLAVVIRRPERGTLHLAECEIPPSVPRFVPVPGNARDVIAVEELVRGNLDLLHPDTAVEGAYVFRVTRGGELDLDEESAEDLLRAVATATERRPLNPAVRVEVERGTPAFARDLLLDSLRREPGTQLGRDDVHEVDGLLDLRAVTELPMPEGALSYPTFAARVPLADEPSLLDAIARRELLAHHPFESFRDTVVRFLAEAAVDPQVTAIKITLYRVGSSSPVVDALLEAARRGKQVVAFVELKARFDEEHNVEWARRLEEAGGHVIYGLVGLKNHAKVALVVRREAGGVGPRRYVHIGTGNYNARSGEQYTDLSLFSAREALTEDVADLFNALTGSSAPPRGLSRGSLVSPHQLLQVVLSHIEREGAHARAGRPARITAKLNGLSDVEVVRALYRAAADGVHIDLVVRGICTLRPGVPARSERIRVVSVVGRFLEHSRIYRFENGGAPEYYIGSADLRSRNLRRRVELLVPVLDGEHRSRLDEILHRYLDDPTGWELRSDGEYQHRGDGPSTQSAFVEALRGAT